MEERPPPSAEVKTGSFGDATRTARRLQEQRIGFIFLLK